ncbi:uncharacterized protein LOC125940128 [Dermacentor silvarum]|uniref:uncharacterized protein LOC125940128 n=1 Tax=Dermacentor silvarum TaxID=543639 RepID=UPI0021017E19|nr:uncharacterized protein LOC125940128 [Dermacentor silvarum]
MARLTTNMLTIACFLAVLRLVTCWMQSPNVTKCPRSEFRFVEIGGVTIGNAKIGLKMTVDAHVHVLRPIGSYPVLEVYVDSKSGKPLPCFHHYLPDELKLCHGTTVMEQTLSDEWRNRCPIRSGLHTGHIAFKLPRTRSTEKCIGNGRLVFTLKIRDEGYIFDCVKFPVEIELD